MSAGLLIGFQRHEARARCGRGDVAEEGGGRRGSRFAGTSNMCCKPQASHSHGFAYYLHASWMLLPEHRPSQAGGEEAAGGVKAKEKAKASAKGSSVGKGKAESKQTAREQAEKTQAKKVAKKDT